MILSGPDYICSSYELQFPTFSCSASSPPELDPDDPLGLELHGLAPELGLHPQVLRPRPAGRTAAAPAADGGRVAYRHGRMVADLRREREGVGEDVNSYLLTHLIGQRVLLAVF